MNAKTQIKLMVLAVASTFGVPLYAADAALQAASLAGEVTPKLYSFDYFKGSDNNTQFLERYNTQQVINGGSLRSGGYLDIDLNIVGNNGQRNYFVLERQGFGTHNHRGTLKADSDTLGFAGYYSHFRTATNGLNFLYSAGSGIPGGTDRVYWFPAAANFNTGYVAQFNNDSPGVTRFNVDRDAYGMSLALKPILLGSKMVAKLDYDGYQRDGNRFATYVVGNSDFAGATRTIQRWRGFEKRIDEKMNRITFNLNGAPGGFNIAYDGAIEKFDNKARASTAEDFRANITADGTTIAAATAARSIHFVPDSTLISNNLRFAKNYGATAVAAGYGLSVLNQDSFSQEQQTAGYNTGKITTNSAYLNITTNAISGVGFEGFAKYNNRKNGSTFPASGVINPGPGGILPGESLVARINSLQTLSYGLAATFRPTVWKSSVTVGWQRDDKDRNLTWSAATLDSVQPYESLYKEKTRSDEVYVKWVARPMPGMILRVTPAYANANQTGLVTEPEKAISVKSKLSYTAKNGMMTSGYYNYRNAKNANNAFIDGLTATTPGATSTKQDTNRKQQAAGASLNLPMSEWINTTASLSWVQDDFASYFLRSNNRRYAGTPNFVNLGTSNYNIDTYVLTLGGDWQVSDELRWNGNYTWSKSKGNTASGEVYTRLSANNTIDGTINSAVHSLALGVDYVVKKNVKLKASYVYEYNKDASYTDLTGGYHTLMMGVGFGF